jgi:membrane protein required for colicin V production
VNYIDIILIIPIAIGAWKGFRKGLILEVFSLLALFAGIYAGVYFSSYAADFLREDIKLHSEYNGIGAFLVTFVAVLVGVYYMGKMVSSMAKIASLEIVNKIMGAVFSSVKALLILSIALMCLKGLNGKFRVLPEEIIEESLLFEPVSNLPLVILPAIEESPWYEQFSFWKNEQLDIQ